MSSKDAEGKSTARKRVQKAPRAAVTCSTCRGKRSRCDAVARAPLPCTVCEAAGRACDAKVEGAERGANDRSELAAQVSRLHELLEDMDGKDKPERKNEVDVDLVGSFTRLCFTDQPELPVAAGSTSLLTETAAWVANEPGAQEEGGPDLSTNGLPDTKAAIIDALPTPEEAEGILEAATAFSLNRMHTMIVFGPPAYAQIFARMKAPRATIEKLTLSQLGELHGCAAFFTVDRSQNTGLRGTLPDHWVSPEELNTRFERMLEHVRMAMKALELANYLEEPDLHVLRTLWVVGTVLCYSIPTTLLLSKGVATATTGLMLAHQMGMHREDVHRSESAVERHNRRAIVSGLCQVAWHISQWLNRLAIFSDDLYDFPSPEYLQDSELPPNARHAGRPTKRDYELWGARHRLLALAHRLSGHLAAPTSTISLKELGEIEKEALSIESRFPDSWRWTVQPDGSLKSGFEGENVEPKERFLAVYFSFPLQTLKLCANRLFLLVPADSLPQSLVDRQRAELVLNARLQTQAWIMLAGGGKGCFASIVGGFQGFITIALACALDTDVPGKHLLRQEVETMIAVLETQRGFNGFIPPAMRRGLAVMDFLLKRPAVHGVDAGSRSVKRKKQAQVPLFAPPLAVRSVSNSTGSDLDHKAKWSGASDLFTPSLASTGSSDISSSTSTPEERSLNGVYKSDIERSYEEAVFSFVPAEYISSLLQY